jgi:dTMP kinase
MTVLIDLPVEEGLRRKLGGPDITRFESNADVAFHRRVRAGFLALATAEPDRFLVVDGRQPADSIEAAIAEALLARIGSWDELRRGRANRGTQGSRPAPSEPERASLRMNK